MMGKRGRTVVYWILRLGVGALFLVTGVLKLGDPAAFAQEIHNYQILPELAPLGAATMPAIEIVLGGALCAAPRAWVRASALGTGALMVMFTAAVSLVLARGINISCGCFGAGSGPITMLTVVRDVALCAACAVIYAMAAPEQPPQAPDIPRG